MGNSDSPVMSIVGIQKYLGDFGENISEMEF